MPQDGNPLRNSSQFGKDDLHAQVARKQLDTMQAMENRQLTNVGINEALSKESWMAAKESIEHLMVKVNHEILVQHLEQFRIPAAARLSVINADKVSKMVLLKADERADEDQNFLD